MAHEEGSDRIGDVGRSDGTFHRSDKVFGREIREVSGLLETFIKTRPVGEMSGGLEAAAGSGVVADVDVDDAAAALARFENGAVGVFEATRFAKGNRNGNRIEINGSKGSIRWAMDQMNTLELYLENDPLGIQGFRSITY